MTRTKAAFTAVAVAALALAPAAFADHSKTATTKAEDPITVDKIVQRHIAALGGEKLLRSGKTFSFSVTGEKMGKPFTKSVTYVKPNKFRAEMTGPDGPMTKAFDGTVAWVKKGNAPAEKLDAEATAMMKMHADFEEPLLDFAKKGTKVKLVGPSEVDQTPAYDLEVTMKSGDVEHHFIDAKTYFLIKRTWIGKDKDGKETPMAVRFGDYKKVQGRMVNHSVTWEYEGKLSKSVVSAVRFDKPVDAKLFAFPAK